MATTTDIYQVDAGTPWAWKLDGALLNFGDNNSQLLATGVEMSYNRTLKSYFPINTKDRVIVAGAPVGKLTIQAIVGPYGDLKAFLESFGNVCNLEKNVITMEPGGISPCESKGDNKPVKFTLTGCLTSSLSVGISENTDGMGTITSRIELTFLSLSVEHGTAKGTGSAAAAAGAGGAV